MGFGFIAGCFAALFKEGQGGGEGPTGREGALLRLWVGGQGGRGVSAKGVNWEALPLQVREMCDRYLIAQQACLEALPILPTLCSEERAKACVKVREGFIFAC